MSHRYLRAPVRLTGAVIVACALAVAGSTVASAASGAPAAPAASGAPTVHGPTGLKLRSDSHYCDGCTPPLAYQGGPVADTSGGGVTITPIYWVPSDTTQFPSGYEDLINRYVKDIAADSGKTDDVYSVLTQYYSADSNGQKANLQDAFQAGDAIIDTQPFPTSGCTPDSDHAVCLTDKQLESELGRVQSADNLATGLANFYPLFTAPDVESVDSSDGSNSVSGFCGFHSSFGSGASTMYYGNEPFMPDGCNEGSWPNGNTPGDSAISTLSHEISEFMTDPSNDVAWIAGSSEVGDICGDDYGSPLGSTDPANAQATEYNQLINGDKYYTQTEFSNSAYATLGKGHGCQQSQATSSNQNTPTPSATEQLFIDATPSAIDADGSTTSQVEFTLTDADGNPVANDKVQFGTYVESGTGSCGKMKQKSASTDDSGYISDDYTASTSNVVCAIVAKDSLGGKAATVEVYQGSTQSSAPTADQTYPSSMHSGQTVTFTNTFKNNGRDPITNPTFDMTIYPGDKTKTNVDSSQTTLAYSLSGASGSFTSIPLTGSTIKDGAILTNWTPPVQPALAAGATLVVTYRFHLAANAAAGIANNDLISFEGYLEQENLASGTTMTVADTYTSEVNVSDTRSTPNGDSNQANAGGDNASSSDSGSTVIGLIVIVVILLVAVGAVVLIVRRRRTGPPQGPLEGPPAGPPMAG